MVCLVLWEMGVVSNIVGGGQELVETSVEEGPHTGLEGVPGEVTRGSNPTSTSSFPKFRGVWGVNSLMEGRKEKEPRKVKNGEPTAHINTFRAYDLFTDETNTMGDEFFLATRESLDSRMGAKMEAIWQGPIGEQDINI